MKDNTRNQTKELFERAAYGLGYTNWTLEFAPLCLKNKSTGELYMLPRKATFQTALAKMIDLETIHTVEDLRNSYELFCGSCNTEQRFTETHDQSAAICNECGNERTI
jgi:hypothetical protein